MATSLSALISEFVLLPDMYVNSLVYAGQQGAKELYSIHNLYEIEPFFVQLSGRDLGSPTFLLEGDEYDPEHDDLYMYLIHLEKRKVYQKRLILGEDCYYDTFFFYEEDFYKSITLYINKEHKDPIEVAYLYLNDGLPDRYMVCNQYVVTEKKYTVEEGRVLRYHSISYPPDMAEGERLETTVVFRYDKEGALDRIDEVTEDKAYVVFKKFESSFDFEAALRMIEDFLVEAVHEQIVRTMRIDEKVYCILLEYCMQGPFPPTVAIGTETDRIGELNGLSCYNAPDMHLFSESGTLQMDLMEEAVQEAYLFIRNALNEPRVEEANVEAKVIATYKNICKRLMTKDYSQAFEKTHDFLVMVRDFEECNEESFYRELYSFKLELEASN